MHSVLKIRSSIKNYEWGKLGSNSIVARFQKASFDDFVVDEKTPYAEMWMGTHSSGPATIPSFDEMKLIDWLSDHPEKLGNNVTRLFGSSKGLPFLFKVLSVNKSLSIQVHPNKEAAAKLHCTYPEYYPDNNHKPEMAIAVTDFEALCGFRPFSDIKHFLLEVPQLRKVIGSEATETFLKNDCVEELKSVFTSLMTCTTAVFQPQLLDIVESFKLGKYKSELALSLTELFLKVHNQYPGDVGCFCLFFLNYLKLKPGEAIYLAANEPHAYLYGDCVECMACSDNVVRAGLTPKFKDVSTLCNMLTYKCKLGKDNIFPYTCDPHDPCRKIYDPPVEEFTIDQIFVGPNHGSYTLKVLNSASILLVVKGEGQCKSEDIEDNISFGSVLFISSDVQVKVNAASELLMYRAYCKG